MAWRERDIFLEYFEDYKTNTEVSRKLYGKSDRPMPIIARDKKKWLKSGYLDKGNKRVIYIKRWRNSLPQSFPQKARDYPYRANLNRFYDELQINLSDKTKEFLKNVFDQGQFRFKLIQRNRDHGLAEMFRQEIEEDIIYRYVMSRFLVKRGKRTEVKITWDKNEVRKVLDKNKKENTKLPIPIKLHTVKVFVEDTRKIFKTYKNREIIDISEEDFMQKSDPNFVGELCKNVLSDNRCKLLNFQIDTRLEDTIYALDENTFKRIRLKASQKQILYQNYCRSINDLLIILGHISDDKVHIDSLQRSFEKRLKKLDKIFLVQSN